MTRMLDLQPIKARLAAATPGPWRAMWSPRLPPMVCSVAGDCGEDCPAHEHCHRCITDVIHQFEDADLIAHTPQDIAALVAEVERLRDAKLTLKDALYELIKQFRSDDVMSIEAALHAAERVLEDA